MLALERLRPDHLDAVLRFEFENRAYFGQSISDRGDEFYSAIPEHHDALLAQQAAGQCAFYVLVDDQSAAIAGRFNLYDLQDGTANVGYRVAEAFAGRGVATEALRDLCRLAVAEHRLDRLSAEAGRANIASRRVLEKVGFAADGECIVGGRPGVRFALCLAQRR